MKLSRIEKRVMNSPRHIQRVINRAKSLLCLANLVGKRDFLELGCGNGATSKHIASNYNLNVTGVDLDPEQIELAQRNVKELPNCRFLIGDATQLPFQDNHFDIVLSFGVMHHISNWVDVLREIARVLKAEGYFIYWDLVYPGIIAKVGKSLQHSYGMTTTHELSLFTEAHNFSVLHASRSKSLIFDYYEAVYRKN